MTVQGKLQNKKRIYFHSHGAYKSGDSLIHDSLCCSANVSVNFIYKVHLQITAYVFQ